MNIRSRFSAALLAGALLLGTSACGTQGTASFASPVELTVWTYYNGDQLETFNRLVEEFNDTVGRERNIEVIASGQGSVNDLETNVMNAAEGKVGAEAMPNIFSAYADTAYAIDRMGLVVDLAPYLDEKEREKYIEAYLEEGDFDGGRQHQDLPGGKMHRADVPQRYRLAEVRAGSRCADYGDSFDRRGRCADGGKVLRLDGCCRPTRRTTAGRCLAATRWRTISSQAQRSWAAPDLLTQRTAG